MAIRVIPGRAGTILVADEWKRWRAERLPGDHLVIEELKVRHLTYVSERSYADVVAAFEAQVGSIEDVGWRSLAAGVSDIGELEANVSERLGDSGFTRFLTVDHGEWVGNYGMDLKGVMYVLGNPMIAITMLRHDVRAGLNVPVRLMIYVDAETKTTRLTYDVPSTLMGDVEDAEFRKAAHGLDAKLEALARDVTQSRA